MGGWGYTRPQDDGLHEPGGEGEQAQEHVNATAGRETPLRQDICEGCLGVHVRVCHNSSSSMSTSLGTVRSLQDEINIIGVTTRPMLQEFVECIDRQEKGQDSGALCQSLEKSQDSLMSLPLEMLQDSRNCFCGKRRAACVGMQNLPTGTHSTPPCYSCCACISPTRLPRNCVSPDGRAGYFS